MHVASALWVLFLHRLLLCCPCRPQIPGSRDPPASSAETIGLWHHSCLCLHYFYDYHSTLCPYIKIFHFFTKHCWDSELGGRLIFISGKILNESLHSVARPQLQWDHPLCQVIPHYGAFPTSVLSDLKLYGGWSERLGFWRHQFGTTRRDSTHVQCVLGWNPWLSTGFLCFCAKCPPKFPAINIALRT